MDNNDRKPESRKGDAFTAEEIAEIRRKFHSGSAGGCTNDVNFGMKFALYAILVGMSAASVLSGFWILQACGTIGLGFMFAHGVELQHQALHRLGFSNNRLNEATGILLGLPMAVSFALYQATHLRHHAFLGTKQNVEAFTYNGDQYGAHSRSPAESLRLMIQRFSMIGHYRQFVQNMWRTILDRDFPGENSRVSRRMRRDYWAILVLAIVLTGISIWFQTALIVWLWLVPLLIATPLHALIEWPEHFGCRTDTANVLQNTRSIRSNAFMTWLTNGNNFHVEHHLMMDLAIERLSELHEVIATRIEHYHRTYGDFLRSILAKRRPPKND